MNTSLHSLRIGVDGGGTGCRAAIANAAGDILALGEAGHANVATDFEQAIQNVETAIMAAALKAGLAKNDTQQAFVHLGLAGVMTPQDEERVRDALPFANCRVTDDRPTSVVGALGSADGFLLSIGTGTIVARKSAAQMSYVGG